MPFFRDLFQNLFGGSQKHQHNQRRFDDRQHSGDEFRNPIWQNDEEDGDDYVDEYGGFNQNPGGFHFQIFTNPFEMARYFESQIDSMMKDFFNFGFNQDSITGEGFNDHQDSPPQLLPPPSIKKRLNPRDEVLKPGYDIPSENPQDKNFKIDKDLDGKITPGDFSRMWQDVDEPNETQLVPKNETPIVPKNKFNFSSFGKSVMSQVIRRPDGTVEERRTVTDGEGNCETTIKRKIGDKVYTSVTKRDKNGVESKTENYENIDESELKNFDSNWKIVEEPKIDLEPLNKFPWGKFFDFNPKL